jgi:hypothetical protein
MAETAPASVPKISDKYSIHLEIKELIMYATLSPFPKTSKSTHQIKKITHEITFITDEIFFP